MGVHQSVPIVIPRLETQAIDAYNDAHHYRGENPLAHLHEDEAPVETDKLKSFHGFLQVNEHRSNPADNLAKEMTHDLEVNFNKIAPFGKEDTAKELQDHAAKTQDTLVDAVENAEVAEIKRAVFRALTRLRAATIKEFDTIARCALSAQFIHSCCARQSGSVVFCNVSLDEYFVTSQGWRPRQSMHTMMHTTTVARTRWRICTRTRHQSRLTS